MTSNDPQLKVRSHLHANETEESTRFFKSMKEIQLAFQQTTLYSRDQIVNRKNLNLIRNEAPPRKIDKCQLWKEVSDEFANTIKVFSLFLRGAICWLIPGIFFVRQKIT